MRAVAFLRKYCTFLATIKAMMRQEIKLPSAYSSLVAFNFNCIVDGGDKSSTAIRILAAMHGENSRSRRQATATKRKK
jgi:hypothetical protein